MAHNSTVLVEVLSTHKFPPVARSCFQQNEAVPVNIMEHLAAIKIQIFPSRTGGDQTKLKEDCILDLD